MNATILKKLSNNKLRFSRAEQQILNAIDSDYSMVTTISIQALAKHAQVSEPTINRLAKKLGCTGFPDFKMQIAQEISQLYQVQKIELSGEEDSQTTRDRILDIISQSVHSIKYSTSIEAIEKSIELFAHANQISFFGLGASGSVALDAQHKFLRLGIPIFAQNDYINQQMLCSTLSSNDILCLISYSGRTKNTIEIGEIAKKNNIPCIGITRTNSPLAQLCDVVLNAETSAQENDFLPMSSRIIHLAIIDIVTTLLSKKKKKLLHKKIQAIQELINRSRL